jgi:hypothetical protein
MIVQDPCISSTAGTPAASAPDSADGIIVSTTTTSARFPVQFLGEVTAEQAGGPEHQPVPDSDEHADGGTHFLLFEQVRIMLPGCRCPERTGSG